MATGTILNFINPPGATPKGPYVRVADLIEMIDKEIAEFKSYGDKYLLAEIALEAFSRILLRASLGA